jgi:hypothetical protein
MTALRPLRVVSLAACAGTVLVCSTFAHHSFAMFDHTRTVTLRGMVTKLQWTNPHGYLELDVTEKDGKASRFTIELTSINMLQRQGWRSAEGASRCRADVVRPLGWTLGGADPCRRDDRRQGERAVSERAALSGDDHSRTVPPGGA